MAKRMKLNRVHSEKLFENAAKRVHPRNEIPVVMRGGIRL